VNRTAARGAAAIAFVLLALAAVAAEASGAGEAPAGSSPRAEVVALLAQAGSARAARRVTARLDRAFREARSGRGDLLEALLDVPAEADGRRRLIAGPNPESLRAAAANALEWTGDPEAASELLARLFVLEREDGRLLFETFARREPDGAPSLPAAR